MSRSYAGNGDIIIDSSGLDDFESMMKDYIKNTSETNAIAALEKGAAAFVKDLKMLPSPRSAIMKSGYTHLVNTFASKKNGTEVEVGWGKYYGPMVERGHRNPHGGGKTPAKAHLVPLFNSNKEKYYKQMLTALKMN